ncbi:hypothetical protein P367_15720 [Comamonas thiooxydans]|nr:hypothetical protein P369_14235 [Comamonas thiooxydans]KGG97531.1 hypothetical protein P367_15720 [Comamonas thiooxydans]
MALGALLQPLLTTAGLAGIVVMPLILLITELSASP